MPLFTGAGLDMKKSLITVSTLVLAVTTSIHAGQAEYDDCILKHLKGAKFDVAASLIKQACEENYRNPSFTSDKRRAYNSCLLEYLSGVESLQATMEIKSACNRKHN
jgi:hypothetical protein